MDNAHVQESGALSLRTSVMVLTFTLTSLIAYFFPVDCSLSLAFTIIDSYWPGLCSVLRFVTYPYLFCSIFTVTDNLFRDLPGMSWQHLHQPYVAGKAQHISLLRSCVGAIISSARLAGTDVILLLLRRARFSCSCASMQARKCRRKRRPCHLCTPSAISHLMCSHKDMGLR